MRDVRDIKRLYLSGGWTTEDCSGGGETDDNQGNPLSCKFMTDACYNLVYLELAACRLTSLAANFSSLVPNVRVLNLNYNFLEDVGPLEGLSRVKKLSIIGSRVKGTKGLIRMVQRMGEIEMVDFRYESRFWERGRGHLLRDADWALDSEGEFRSGRGVHAREREAVTQVELRRRADQMCWPEG